MPLNFNSAKIATPILKLWSLKLLKLFFSSSFFTSTSDQTYRSNHLRSPSHMWVTNPGKWHFLNVAKQSSSGTDAQRQQHNFIAEDLVDRKSPILNHLTSSLPLWFPNSKHLSEHRMSIRFQPLYVRAVTEQKITESDLESTSRQCRGNKFDFFKFCRAARA